MVTLGRPGDARLRRLLADACAAEPNYAPVGATIDGELPPGYRHGRYDIVLGQGEAAFVRATHALRHWAAHRSLGMRVVGDGDPPPIATGGTVLVVVPVGPLTAVARCRIVAVVDEPDRFGFAYGSLPGHPERGEEAFVVHRRPDGAVTFAITVFSRHADPLLRLGAPVASLLQRRFTHRYLRAVRAAVHERGAHVGDRRPH